jgi:hypothetical protein
MNIFLIKYIKRLIILRYILYDENRYILNIVSLYSWPINLIYLIIKVN